MANDGRLTVERAEGFQLVPLRLCSLTPVMRPADLGPVMRDLISSFVTDADGVVRLTWCILPFLACPDSRPAQAASVS